jgi:anti-sigma factor RsiW
MNATEEHVPDDIEALLPWHAAGTLNRHDSERVAEALARDPDLARRYALVREELGETIVLNETLGAPSARAMNDLFAKIDAEPARKVATSRTIATRVSEFIASLSPRTLAYAGAAAALAIIIQAGFIANVVINEKGSGGYVTASAPSNASEAGRAVLMRFAPQAAQADVTKFLEVNKLSIVSGPADGGFFTVRVAEKPLPDAELSAIVKKLRADKVVGFIATVE